ncbi:MAG: hypothetical protein JWN46_2903 [Acidimicrobiales bacterium]|nr:hypothetical protein [Acidimicrobiales bacterium]
MGAGSQLAAERDRWPFRWQVTDLDAHADALLLALRDGEDLVAVVPVELAGAPATSGGAPPVLLALTDHRVVVVGLSASSPADPAMVLASAPLAGWPAPAPTAGPKPAAGAHGTALDVAIGPLVLRLDLADDASRRFDEQLTRRTRAT